jgi:hypothetical protein
MVNRILLMVVLAVAAVSLFACGNSQRIQAEVMSGMGDRQVVSVTPVEELPGIGRAIIRENPTGNTSKVYVLLSDNLKKGDPVNVYLIRDDRPGASWARPKR